MTKTDSIQTDFRKQHWLLKLLNGLPKHVYVAFVLVLFVFCVMGVYKTLDRIVGTYNDGLQAFIAEDPSRFKTFPEAAAAYKKVQEESAYQEYVKKKILQEN